MFKQVEKVNLPELVRPQSICVRPPPLARYERVATANKVSKSLDAEMKPAAQDVVYEYDLDDAAGIPSLAFFKKSYSLPV